MKPTSSPTTRSRPVELRIRPVSDSAGSLTDALSKTVLDELGRPLPIFALLAHHEQLLRRFNGFGALLRTSPVNDPAHRELIVLRVAWRTDCPFEFDQHLPLAVAAGVSARSIAAAIGAEEGPENPVDRLLLVLTDEILDQDSVTDQTWSEANDTWAPAQLIELVMTAGFFRMAAAFINSTGLRPRAGWERGRAGNDE
jgi:AhpD family alkylhydroperoxidase